MSKYFAKYLPVEGEAKEGDIYSCDQNQLVNWEGREKVFHRHTNKTKLKLFLCSRDILVEDDVIYQKDYSKQKLSSINKQGLCSFRMDFTDDLDTHKLSDLFKVIGEISPKASWVKEGDEFEEAQLQAVAAYKGNINDFTSYILESVESFIPYIPYKKIIQIKCPTCKTFH